MDSFGSTIKTNAVIDNTFQQDGGASKELLDLDIFSKPPNASKICSNENYTNILLVDDCALDRKLIRQLIEKSNHPFQISDADGIDTALRMISEHEYDVLLLDYRLPDGIGPERIEDLRDRANNFHLPIIVLTGHGDEHTAIESFKDGASDYMPKDDMSTSSLFRSINNAMHKARLQHRINEQRRAMIEANEILKTQNREINSFYQTVSHELKTPLTGAREYTSLVMDGVVGALNPEQKELLSCAIQCCDSLKILVDDLLDAAEFENDGMRISLEICEAKDIVESALSCVGLLPQNKNAHINFSCEDTLPLVKVDKTRITQVITNIVNNAVKFSDGNSEIDISLKLNRPLRHLQIDIADNGPGIPAGLTEKVFEKFYQVKENTESNSSGMGLGLYLCKKIIEAHGGYLTLKSTVGIGSIFTFSIPFLIQ
ncbi:MAG: ATP-binding protein [Pseudomonadales bacterium]